MARQIVSKSIGGTMLAALMLTTTAERASADLGDALLGAGAVAIIGCATGAINCKKRQRSSGTAAPRKSTGMSAAQRQQNREMQSALNSFGFNAGTVDGVPGRKTREAISGYQGYMGYPVTGRLNDWERQTLIDSWNKLNAGAGNAYPRTMAALGPRGLLNIAKDPSFPAQYGDPVVGGYNNQQPGYNNQQQPGGTWNQQQAGLQPNAQGGANFQQPQQQYTPTPNTGGQVVGAATGGAALGGGIQPLKPLQPTGQVAVSAAARCELVDQTTRIQGGVIMAANMTDPNQALSEKFCEARGFAITQGGSLASQFAVSEDELTATCGQIEAAFAPAITSLPNAPMNQVLDSAQSTAQGLGLADAGTAATYGQICLGIGYRLDNAEMALAGALTMMVAGQRPYGEIVGHHLREGFGVQRNRDTAGSWYLDAVGALEQGAQPVFVPSMTQERIQTIRTALQLQDQQAAGAAALPQVVPAASTLPTLQPIQN